MLTDHRVELERRAARIRYQKEIWSLRAVSETFASKWEMCRSGGSSSAGCRHV